MSSSSTRVSNRSIGYVKWFNKKQGFGFIHVLDGAQKDQDIFVHFSSLRVPVAAVGQKLDPSSYGQQMGYKYLIQGEYVEFIIENAVKENHKFHAVDVTGIYENNILCHTRQENSVQRYSTGSRPARAHSSSFASE